PASVTLGDVNGDGRLDIIIANSISASASVLLGNCNGTFQPQATFATGTRTRSVTLGDVNADGKLDMVTANYFFSTASVLLGNGDGTFKTQATLATGTNPISVTLGDVNRDGRLDIVTANQYGDNASVLLNSLAFTGQTYTVGSTTTTVLSSGTNPSVFGQSVTFTATVTGSSGTPTGTVTFKNGANTLGTGTLNGSGIATFSTSALAVGGPYSITAVYGGDSSNLTSTSSATSQVVNQAGTTTTLSASPNPSVFGQPVAFTVTVAPVSPGSGTPTGSVSFFDGATLLGTRTLSSGSASFSTGSLSVASHSITAVYAGDSSFTGSTSSATTQV
ncbi:MAG: Ig-like domain repeat protein, partial [Planctomycetia bacterium]